MTPCGNRKTVLSLSQPPEKKVYMSKKKKIEQKNTNIQPYSSFWLNPALRKPTAGHDKYAYASALRNIAQFVSIITGRTDVEVSYSVAGESYTNMKDKIYVSADVLDKVDCTVGLVMHEAMHLKESTPLALLFRALYNGRYSYLLAESVKIDLSELEAMVLDKFPDETAADVVAIQLHRILNILEDRRIDQIAWNRFPGYRPYYQALYNEYFYSETADRILQNKETSFENYVSHLILMINKNASPTALPGLDKVWKLVDLENIFRFNKPSDRDYPDILKCAVSIFKVILENCSSMEVQTPSREYEFDCTLKAFSDGRAIKVGMAGKSSQEISQLANDKITIKQLGGKGPYSRLIFYDLTGNRPLTDRPFIDYEVYTDVVKRGIQLGRMLANKVLILNDDAPLKLTRQKYGKLDRRLLAEIPAGTVDVFSKMFLASPKPIFVDICVDASGSMKGKAWRKTIQLISALGAMSQMLKTVDVRVSLRDALDDVRIVIVYDSTKDSLSRMIHVFSRLAPSGSTPEGVAFEPLQKRLEEFKGIRYFINISDGEPNTGAETVTEEIIKKFKRQGIKVLSYFVSNSGQCPPVFHRMYKESAKNINVESVPQIAKTLNKMFVDVAMDT